MSGYFWVSSIYICVKMHLLLVEILYGRTAPSGVSWAATVARELPSCSLSAEVW